MTTAKPAKPKTTKRVAVPKMRPLVGWREIAALPELGIRHVKVKVDTGARTSALHAADIVLVERRGANIVRFRVYTHEDNDTLSRPIECPLLSQRRVKSSNGQTETRPVISTRVIVGQEIWDAEVTLTTRDQMGFRMLLGRTALKRRFWVDPGRSNIQGEPARAPRKRTPTPKPRHATKAKPQ